MTTFLLVRHAESNTAKNILAGRAPGVHLSNAGARQAYLLARTLASIKLAALWSSPLERAVETANVLSEEMQIPLNISANLNEVDYGRWTGKAIDALATDPLWRSFNSSRGSALIPGGESVTNVQQRMISHLEHLHKCHNRGNVVLVTHAEPIRLVLGYYLKASDYIHERLEISPASVSTLRLSPEPMILNINHVQMVPSIWTD